LTLTLIDTSLWTHAMRQSGDPVLRDRVRRRLNDGSAAWCELIRLELWKGHRIRDDGVHLSLMEQRLPRLSINSEVWNLASTIAHQMQRKGLVIPTSDFIIFACARVHGAALEHNDKHFDMLAEHFSIGSV
jgi:predicted nucleic acid-binding protein